MSKAKRPHAVTGGDQPRLRGLSEIYRFFRERPDPVYFISPTAYNLLGIEEWVAAWRYITYFDSFGGHHPRSFSPVPSGPRDFESFESVNSYLLGNKEVVDHIGRGGPGQVLFVMFDEETEEQAHELGLDIALPPRALREWVDSKVVTTKLGEEAGVASAPNTVGRAASWKELKKIARTADLGQDLVVQTPYGDSGRTTFFIRGREDFDEHAEVLADEDLKVMRRIPHLPGTLEACATRHGTLVGPIQTDLTGYAELTPYRGGWAGNDIYPDVLTPRIRAQIRSMARRLGKRLYQVGYRGVFCMDFLYDVSEDKVYLGEINPRISGASPMTNLITSTYGGVPLFLFHLLEFADVDWDADLAMVQHRWTDFDSWSQLVLKQVSDDVELITQAPSSGLWRMAEDGSIAFVREEHDWHQVRSYEQAYYLRVYGAGEYRYPGADMGVLVTRGRMQSDTRELSERGRRWAAAIAAEFRGVPPAQPIEVSDAVAYAKWF